MDRDGGACSKMTTKFSEIPLVNTYAASMQNLLEGLFASHMPRFCSGNITQGDETRSKAHGVWGRTSIFCN